jgi:hypothetical protein
MQRLFSKLYTPIWNAAWLAQWLWPWMAPFVCEIFHVFAVVRTIFSATITNFHTFFCFFQKNLSENPLWLNDFMLGKCVLNPFKDQFFPIRAFEGAFAVKNLYGRIAFEPTQLSWGRWVAALLSVILEWKVYCGHCVAVLNWLKKQVDNWK